jgi:DnaJ-class molecular chaperone
MKRPTTKPNEDKCPACNGTGFPIVKQPAQPNRKIYPPPCRKCGGKGRISEPPTERQKAAAGVEKSATASSHGHDTQPAINVTARHEKRITP